MRGPSVLFRDRRHGACKKRFVARIEDDDAGARPLQRHVANTVQTENLQRDALKEGRVVAFDGIFPSFFRRGVSIYEASLD